MENQLIDNATKLPRKKSDKFVHIRGHKINTTGPRGWLTIIDDDLKRQMKPYGMFNYMMNELEDTRLTLEQKENLSALFVKTLISSDDVCFGQVGLKRSIRYQVDFFPHYDTDSGRGVHIDIKSRIHSLEYREEKIFMKEIYIPYSFFEFGFMDQYGDHTYGDRIMKKYDRPNLLFHGGFRL